MAHTGQAWAAAPEFDETTILRHFSTLAKSQPACKWACNRYEEGSSGESTADLLSSYDDDDSLDDDDFEDAPELHADEASLRGNFEPCALTFRAIQQSQAVQKPVVQIPQHTNDLASLLAGVMQSHGGDSADAGSLRDRLRMKGQEILVNMKETQPKQWTGRKDNGTSQKKKRNNKKAPNRAKKNVQTSTDGTPSQAPKQ